MGFLESTVSSTLVVASALLVLGNPGHVQAAEADSASGGEALQLHLDALRALETGETKPAAKTCRRALKALGQAEEIVSTDLLAALHFTRGLALWDQQSEAAMEAWREALRVRPDLSWSGEGWVEPSAETVFEALRREVASYSRIDLGTPEEAAAERVYVAGRSLEESRGLPEGRHLVQARCDEGQVVSRWWSFGNPPDYQRLCPGGFTSPLADNEGCDEVEFDDFGNPVYTCGEESVAVGSTLLSALSGD